MIEYKLNDCKVITVIRMMNIMIRNHDKSNQDKNCVVHHIPL